MTNDFKGNLMKKFIILIFVFTLSVFADGGMKEYLGLSAEQDQKMRGIQELCRVEDSICFKKLDELRRQLFIEAGKEKPSAEKINSIADEIGLQHSTLVLCLANQVRVVKTILTQEQFDKFVGYRKNKGKRPNPNKPK